MDGGAFVTSRYMSYIYRYMKQANWLWPAERRADPANVDGATEIAGQENAGLENDGQICRGGKCRTGN